MGIVPGFGHYEAFILVLLHKPGSILVLLEDLGTICCGFEDVPDY